MKVLQFNCNGVPSKIEEMVDLMSREVLSTKINSRSDLSALAEAPVSALYVKTMCGQTMLSSKYSICTFSQLHVDVLNNK